MFDNMVLLKKNKNLLIWFQKTGFGTAYLHKMWWPANWSLNYVVGLVDCWNENNPDALFSSTNRAAMTLGHPRTEATTTLGFGFRCFAQRQRRRQKREEGEGERARARNGMLLLSPSKSTSYAVLVLLLFALVILEMNCFLCRQENAGLYN
jgi:hypothetical protein